MANELIVAIGGLILSGLTYFAGVWRTERRYDKTEKKERMNIVFNRYMEFRKTAYTAGIDGLQKAGVATLKSDSEIRELSERIVNHAERNPLGGNPEIFNNVDLKKFFDCAAKERINFLQIPIDEVIKKSGASKA